VQVSGRAGRFLPDGKVIIQTFQPENPAIRYSATNQLEAFYQEELEIRKELGFPPFSRLCRLVFRGRKQQVVTDMASQFARQLSQSVSPGFQILGPAECPLSVIAGNFRYQIIVRTSNFKEAHKIITQCVKDFSYKKDFYLEVDMDPVNLL
jgi:primosomal protein N' (replication factor Y)